jgi:hypothetical protein
MKNEEMKLWMKEAARLNKEALAAIEIARLCILGNEDCDALTSLWKAARILERSQRYLGGE